MPACSQSFNVCRSAPLATRGNRSHNIAQAHEPNDVENCAVWIGEMWQTRIHTVVWQGEHGHEHTHTKYSYKISDPCIHFIYSTNSMHTSSRYWPLIKHGRGGFVLCLVGSVGLSWHRMHTIHVTQYLLYKCYRADLMRFICAHCAHNYWGSVEVHAGCITTFPMRPWDRERGKERGRERQRVGYCIKTNHQRTDY